MFAATQNTYSFNCQYILVFLKLHWSTLFGLMWFKQNGFVFICIYKRIDTLLPCHGIHGVLLNITLGVEAIRRSAFLSTSSLLLFCLVSRWDTLMLIIPDIIYFVVYEGYAYIYFIFISHLVNIYNLTK